MTNRYTNEFWLLLAKFPASDQILRYYEIVTLLDSEAPRTCDRPLRACEEVRGAAFILDCNPPDSGYVSSPLADEFCRDPDKV